MKTITTVSPKSVTVASNDLGLDDQSASNLMRSRSILLFKDLFKEVPKRVDPFYTVLGRQVAGTFSDAAGLPNRNSIFIGSASLGGAQINNSDSVYRLFYSSFAFSVTMAAPPSTLPIIPLTYASGGSSDLPPSIPVVKQDLILFTDFTRFIQITNNIVSEHYSVLILDGFVLFPEKRLFNAAIGTANLSPYSKS